MVLDSLLLTAKSFVANLFRFEAAKNAPERSKELRREMHTVCDTLESLNLMLPKGEDYSHVSSLKDSLSEFASILAEWNKRVEPMSAGPPSSWPFSKDENLLLLLKIEKYQEAFTMALKGIYA